MPRVQRSFIETLARVPLFQDLSASEIAAIAAQIYAAKYDAGELIFSEGDRGGDLLIVQQGSVRVLSTAASGRQQLLSIEREGSSLGEVSVFDGGSYSTSAVAITPVILLRLKGEHFRCFCASHPDIAFRVIRVLGYRLRRLRNLVEQLSFATVRDRLILYLLNLVDDHGIPYPDGTEMELHENNEELAARLGTVRELVSRNFGRLHGEGLIQMRRRAVIIPDRAALRAELKS